MRMVTVVEKKQKNGMNENKKEKGSKKNKGVCKKRLPRTIGEKKRRKRG